MYYKYQKNSILSGHKTLAPEKLPKSIQKAPENNSMLLKSSPFLDFHICDNSTGEWFLWEWGILYCTWY